ncbi:MAG: hypothetical protein ACRC8S_04820 [Fimbriiglobus sp.]
MPRLCEPCRWHTADDSVTVCSSCGGPVKFTLLAPPGEKPEPIAGLPGSPEMAEKRVGFKDFFRGKTGKILGGAIVLGLVVVSAMLLFRWQSFEAKVAKIKPGMKMLDAMRIFGDENGPAMVNSVRVRFRGIPIPFTMQERTHAPIDVYGFGSMDYEGGFQHIRIHYADGLVTKVEK